MKVIRLEKWVQSPIFFVHPRLETKQLRKRKSLTVPTFQCSTETGVGRSADTAGLGTCVAKAVVRYPRGSGVGLAVSDVCGADVHVCCVDTCVDARVQFIAPAYANLRLRWFFHSFAPSIFRRTYFYYGLLVNSANEHLSR